MKEFFRKLFGLKNEMVLEEYKPKYDIKVLSATRVDLEEEQNLPYEESAEIVECVVNGAKEKYIYFAEDEVLFNFASLITPKDEDFKYDFQTALFEYKDELNKKELEATYKDFAKRVKDQVLGITTVSLPASTTKTVIVGDLHHASSSTVIEQPPAQTQAPLPKSAASVMDRFVEKAIKEIEANKTDEIFSKSEETAEPAVAKKKGGRPKKVLN